MTDPQIFKQVIDCVGYTVMGLAGLFGAWQRMRAATASGPSASAPEPKKERKGLPMDRLEKVERELVLLRNRQDERHQENQARQSAILQQQTAMFDLLVQQRSAVDKILTKMGGLS